MTKARVLTVVGVVQLVSAILICLALLAGAPAPVSGAGLGFTPTHTPPPTDTPDGSVPSGPDHTPVPQPEPKEAELTVAKSASASEVLPGGQVSYVIEVCNVGKATAENVVVSDAVPSELALLSASSSLGRVVIVGNGVRAEMGALLPGVCGTLRISALVGPHVEPGTEIRNVASVPKIYDDAYVRVGSGLLPMTGEPFTFPLGVIAGLFVTGLGFLAGGQILRARPVSARESRDRQY